MFLIADNSGGSLRHVRRKEAYKISQGKADNTRRSTGNPGLKK